MNSRKIAGGVARWHHLPPKCGGAARSSVPLAAAGVHNRPGRWMHGLALSVLWLTAGCGGTADAPPKPAAEQWQPQQGSATRPRPTPPVPRVKAKPDGTLPAFEMVGGEAGFKFERNDDIRGLHRILEANGGGVALFDFDRDGWLDLYMTNGCPLPLKFDRHKTPGALFHHRGDWRFERINQVSHLVQFGYSTGCAVGDYDADGFDDLYIAAFGPDALWRNMGDGTFANVTDAAGIDVPAWGSSVAFADINGDGWLDLYVVNYLVESDETPRLCPHPSAPDGYGQCSPALFEGADDVLLISDGGGRFDDVSATAGITGLRGKGLGVVIADFDRDGRPEIFVANDGEANFLLVQTRPPPSDAIAPATATNLGKLQFRDQALASGVALNESGYAQANMGIAAGDYDANGTLDLFITTFYGDSNTLYAHQPGLVFADATRSTNLAASSRSTLGFGTFFFDADNDGWLDLFVANGHIDDRHWMERGEPYRMRPQLYRNGRHGAFTDVSEWGGPYFEQEWLGRGAAVGDLDRDGLPDFVVSHQLAASYALRNTTSTENGSLVLRLVGVVTNRNGYGAWVEVVDGRGPCVGELVSGGSFHAASAPEIHVGLGESQQATLQIHWPSGQVDTHRDLRTGTWVAIEGRGAAKFDK